MISIGSLTLNNFPARWDFSYERRVDSWTTSLLSCTSTTQQTVPIGFKLHAPMSSRCCLERSFDTFGFLFAAYGDELENYDQGRDTGPTL